MFSHYAVMGVNVWLQEHRECHDTVKTKQPTYTSYMDNNHILFISLLHVTAKLGHHQGVQAFTTELHFVSSDCHRLK